MDISKSQDILWQYFSSPPSTSALENDVPNSTAPPLPPRGEDSETTLVDILPDLCGSTPKRVREANVEDSQAAKRRRTSNDRDEGHPASRIGPSTRQTIENEISGSRTRHPTKNSQDASFGPETPPSKSITRARSLRPSPPVTPAMARIKSMSPEKRKDRSLELTKLIEKTLSAKPISAPDFKPNSPEYVSIYHDDALLVEMRRHSLSSAVEWEVARLSKIFRDNNFTLQDWCHVFEQLKGSNVAARRVLKVLRDALKKKAGNTVVRDLVIEETQAKAQVSEGVREDQYEELDSEDESFDSKDHRSLGAGSLKTHWYGGKVLQVVRLHDPHTKESAKRASLISRYGFRIEKQTIGRSCRLARYYGSRRLIQVSIPDSILKNGNNRLVEFFAQTFLLNGRVFEALYAKENSVYLVETGALPSRAPDPHVKSLWMLMNWHNPVDLNDSQVGSKWAARFALAFSTSVPVCQVLPGNVIHIHDIAAAWNGPGKKPDKLVFTDGCGYLNRSAARCVKEALDLDSIPSAVQMRLGGAKGMLVVHPTDASADPKVWLRDSQVKVHYPITSVHPSHLMLDLVRTPRNLKLPSHLSSEVIISLSHRKVPTDVFQNLFRIGLQQELAPTDKFETPGDDLKLWQNLCRRILGTRLRRQAAGAARAYGYGDNVRKYDDLDFADIDVDIVEALESEENHIGTDLDSALPTTLEETIMGFLDAGFEPGTCPRLREKLKILNKIIIDVYCSKFRIPVQLSAEGFAIPDPFAISSAAEGVLKCGEVFCRSSKSWVDSEGIAQDTVVGPVLVTRHPCKFESDIQKLTAVDCPALREYRDIVIFSCQGERSPLNLLGGGDYDGDVVSIIWQPEIVNSFVGTARHALDPPDDFLKKNFVMESAKLADELISPLSGELGARSLQRFLLSSLSHQSTVGLYSNWHEIAVYRLGLAHPVTERLAYMFSTVMDASKSGLILKQDVWATDQKEWGCRQSPPWKSKTKSTDEAPNAYTKSPNDIPKKATVRPRHLGSFVMDILRKTADEAHSEYIKNLQELDRREQRDSCLLEPYNNARRRVISSGCAPFSKELEVLEQRVKSAWLDYNTQIREKEVKFLGKAAERRRTLQLFSSNLRSDLEQFQATFMYFGPQEILRVAASFAYLHDLTQCNNARLVYDEGSGFPWELFFRELKAIKADKAGSSTVLTRYYERSVLHDASLKHV